jgi:hypothetical protein
MLSEYEARKLQDDMKRELNAGPGTVIRYGVFILLVVGLAIFGTPSKQSVDRNVASPVAQAGAAPFSHSMVAFEERRQRFIQANPDAQIAREFAAQKQWLSNSKRRHIAFDHD